MNAEAWGRVDETNTVFVRDGEIERRIGQFPDGTAAEAEAYFVRKYVELEGQITLLEQRVLRGTAGVEVSKTIQHLQEQLVAPAVFGDIPALRARVSKLSERADALVTVQQAEKEAARQASLAERTKIVTDAEAIAASDLATARWKEVSASMERLFEQWQAAQKSGPHLPKAQTDDLWKRFRKARQHVDNSRRAYFAEMDATNKDVKARKLALINDAQALASRGADGVGAYRQLLEKWKLAGRASRKVDDQLWEQFKSAGDVLYAAKSEEDARTDEGYAENLTLKLALLNEAEPLLRETDFSKARDRLLFVQKKWDAIGKVPRASVKEVEARMRKLEAHVRQLGDAHWQATNPETQARTSGLKEQLVSSIAELEATLASANANRDKQLITSTEQAIATQRSWLAAIDS